MQGSFAAFVVGVGLCTVAGILARRRMPITVPPLALLIASLLIAVSCVSASRIGFTRNILFGTGLEWGTVASFMLFSISFIAGSMVPSRARSLFLSSFEVASVVGALAVASIAFGLTPVTLIATSWVQLSFILCAASLVGAARADAETRSKERVVHIGVALISFGAFMMLFIFEAGVVAIVSALIIAYGASRSTQERFPYASVILALTLLAVLVCGMRSPVIPLSDDARPSQYATSLVTGPEFMHSTVVSLIGTGPRTFPYLWNKYRMSDENMGPLWRLTPKYSYSAFSTVTLEEGLLGMFARALFLMIPIVRMWSYSRVDDTDRRLALGALSVLALFFIASTFVSPLGMPILVIGALAIGMCIPADDVTGIVIRARARVLVVAAGVFIVGGACIWVSSHQLLAARADSRGLALLKTGDTTGAIVFLTNAVHWWETSEYDQDAASAYLSEGLAAQKSGSFVIAQQDIDTAATFAGKAVQRDSYNFSRWIFEASLYITLMQHDVADTSDKAQDALKHAAALAPTRPEVAYGRAIVALANGNTAEALAQIQEALLLKPDYAEVLQLQQKFLAAQ